MHAATKLPTSVVRKAVRLTFAQAMLGAVYTASTGGMFLIGYALKLGADNFRIGLLSTIPMMCVVVQLFSAWTIERGLSRRLLTFWGALLNAAGWVVIILIPYVAASGTPSERIALLIGTIAVVNLFGHIGGNARASWIGDLVPDRFRGAFFGRLFMFAGIIATFFAVGEGAFLDAVQSRGISAFGILFGFGMIVGTANALLFLPQPDVSIGDQPDRPPFGRMVLQTLTNRDLRQVTLFTLVWSLQGIAGPFYATYMLRDLGMPFLGVGLVNSTLMIAMVLSGPFWGRIVDRFGSRPTLVACTFLLGILQAVWLFLDRSSKVYAVIPLVNVPAGLAISGVGVALNTLIYKVTPQRGRSVQLAVFSIVVVLAGAPFPTLGGLLPGLFRRLGFAQDLRATFYVAGIFLVLSTWVASRIRESRASRTRDMLRSIRGRWTTPFLRVWPWGADASGA